MERSLYIETSVWGMIPQGQPREMRRASLQLLRLPRKFHVSQLVLREINDASEEVRAQIMDFLEKVRLEALEVFPECEELAQSYIDTGILSPRRREDGLHVAVATYYELDVLVSWNHRHLANVRKTEQYRGANLIKGYSHTPLILTPLEVLNE